MGFLLIRYHGNLFTFIFQEPICKIDGGCYDDGDTLDSLRTCLRCDLSQSDTQWTQQVMEFRHDTSNL